MRKIEQYKKVYANFISNYFYQKFVTNIDFRISVINREKAYFYSYFHGE